MRCCHSTCILYGDRVSRGLGELWLWTSTPCIVYLGRKHSSSIFSQATMGLWQVVLTPQVCQFVRTFSWRGLSTGLTIFCWLFAYCCGRCFSCSDAASYIPTYRKVGTCKKTTYYCKGWSASNAKTFIFRFKASFK